MARSSARTEAAACPCGSGDPYSRCCRPFHAGRDLPPTAEALMRSRYSAFTKRLPEYLLATWHPATRPAGLALDPTQRWRRLTVVSTTDGGIDDDTGTVTFEAEYDSPAGAGTQREESWFERVGGRWTYRSPTDHGARAGALS